MNNILPLRVVAANDDTALLLIYLNKHHGWVASLGVFNDASTLELKENSLTSHDQMDWSEGTEKVPARFPLDKEQECRDYYTKLFHGMFSRILIVP